MATKIKAVIPKYDGVLIRPLTEDSKTKGGLHIPEVHHGNKPYARGEVVAVGSGRPTQQGNIVPCETKVGEIVLYQRGAGTVFPVEGEHLTLVPEMAIFATIEVEEVEEPRIITLDLVS
jgi:chaperonin GroES